MIQGIRFYKKQGASIVPGASRFIVGNLPDIAGLVRKRAKSEKPMKTNLALLMEKIPGCDADENAAINHKVAVYSPLGRLVLIISDSKWQL